MSWLIEALTRGGPISGEPAKGIGFAIAQRLLADGLSVLIHSFTAHDAQQPRAPRPGELDAVIAELGGPGDRLDHLDADLADPDAPTGSSTTRSTASAASTSSSPTTPCPPPAA